MTDRPPPDDRYARESFTWRRMQPWQYWTMTIVFIILVLLAIFLWPAGETTPPGETEAPAGETTAPAGEGAPAGGETAPDAGTPPAGEAPPGGGEPAAPGGAQ